MLVGCVRGRQKADQVNVLLCRKYSKLLECDAVGIQMVTLQQLLCREKSKSLTLNTMDLQCS